MDHATFMDGVLRTASHDWHTSWQSIGSEDQMQLLHAVLGISSEIGELRGAEKDPVNFVEELGDILWFCALAYHALRLEFIPLSKPTRRHVMVAWSFESREATMRAMTFTVGDLCSHVKAYIYYGRALDREAFLISLASIVIRVNVLCEKQDTCVQEVMEINQKKLRARFPDKFTAECANTRDLEVERKVLEDAQG